MAGSGELTACSHPEPHKARRLINRVNCKEGTLSKQADLRHCGIKEYPSLETPSLTPSTCNKNQKPSASRLALLQLPQSPAQGQVHRKCWALIILIDISFPYPTAIAPFPDKKPQFPFEEPSLSRLLVGLSIKVTFLPLPSR